MLQKSYYLENLYCSLFSVDIVNQQCMTVYGCRSLCFYCIGFLEEVTEGWREKETEREMQGDVNCGHGFP